jgi:folate-binding protein YgfZ
MTPAKMALLPDRGVVRVAGEDASRLLQGTITNDMDLLDKQPAVHAALLTPQGKILFEFFVVKAADEGFLLEMARDQVAGLAKRLAMYKLRARVDIADATPEYRVFALWGGAPATRAPTGRGVGPFDDPRLRTLGSRILAEARFAADVAASANGSDETPEAYHAHRIGLGVPEGGRDYPFGDTFPHEANLDLLSGVSFTKGCFVGQEVVSRVQHRGSARKRIVIVEGDDPLKPGAEIVAGPAAIGTIGSAAGRRALALLRIDRAQEAIDKGERLSAGGSRISMRFPGYFKSDRAVAAS